MDILTEKKDGILRVELNRPQKKNAITIAMYAALTEALADGERDPNVRAIVLHGAGGVFAAGNDLEDFLKHPPSDDDAPVIRFLLQISRTGKPIIAAVVGAAVGIGTTMLLHCDLVYAGEGAKFSLPFTQLGLCPEAASSYLLPAVAGYQRAAERLLLGEPFGPAEARECGFVNKVLPDAEVLDFALAQARKLVALPASSLHTTKLLMKRGRGMAVEEQIREEIGHFQRLLGAPAAKEAFTAFFERRKPDFSKVE
jgi:enoyl-CoA hydratase/carnithine racemase